MKIIDQLFKLSDLYKLTHFLVAIVVGKILKNVSTSIIPSHSLKKTRRETNKNDTLLIVEKSDNLFRGKIVLIHTLKLEIVQVINFETIYMRC